MSAALIAIDWGSSNFRAYLLDANGVILNKRFIKLGILKIIGKNFGGVLQSQIGGWLHQQPELPIIMSGMIGSRQGWREVPYLHCPLALTQLAEGLQTVEFNGRPIYIVPGLMIASKADHIDVMRGEEVQILGALATMPTMEHAIYCLPGTHCKWARVEKDRLIDFTTYMTGELFTLLSRHSILAKFIQGTHIIMEEYLRGIADIRKNPALLSQLFQVRTQVLAEKLTQTAVHSYLSGLLIGAEIDEARQINALEQETVILIANTRVTQLYSAALKAFGINSRATDADIITARGLLTVSQLAHLINKPVDHAPTA